MKNLMNFMESGVNTRDFSRGWFTVTVSCSFDNQGILDYLSYRYVSAYYFDSTGKKERIFHSIIRYFLEGGRSIDNGDGTAGHYSYALTPAEDIQEADYCKWLIDSTGLLLELPVFFDMEDEDHYKLYNDFNFSRRNVTDICRAFLKNIKPLNAEIYAGFSWLEDLIDWWSLNCPVWNTQYYHTDFFKGFMWQYTANLVIGGKLFDGNILYEV